MNIITDEDISTLRQELFIEFCSQFSEESLEEMGITVDNIARTPALIFAAFLSHFS